MEELSERLCVSKSHLVRAFTHAVGVSAGRYLTRVRIEAAMRLLQHREYTLEVVASLCGFSGANYLCRVFKKETGQSPAQWRALVGRAAAPGLSPEESLREQELLVLNRPAQCATVSQARLLFLCTPGPPAAADGRQHRRQRLCRRKSRPHAVHAKQIAQQQRAAHNGHTHRHREAAVASAGR